MRLAFVPLLGPIVAIYRGVVADREHAAACKLHADACRGNNYGLADELYTETLRTHGIAMERNAEGMLSTVLSIIALLMIKLLISL